MPRKSSFLQGFEVGSALYSRGYQQATQRRQMQLDEDQRKIQNRLAQGRMDQEDARFKMLQEQNERLVGQQKLDDENDEIAANAWFTGRKLLDGPKGAEAFAAWRPEGELLIRKSKKIGGPRGPYDTWHEGVLKSNVGYATIRDSKNTAFEKAIHANQGIQREWNRKVKLAAKFGELFPGEPELDLNNPEDMALAQVRIYENELQQFAIFQKVPLGPNWELTDINKDGKIDQRDVTAVKAERLKFGLAEAKRLGDTAEVERIERDLERDKKKMDYAAGIAKKTRADVTRLAKQAKALENLGQLSRGSAEYKKGVMQAALSGNDFSQLKGVMQPGMIIDIGRVRLDLQGTLESGKGPDGKPLTPYEKMKLSGVYTTRLAQSESETISKTLVVREQIAAIEDKVFGANKLSTGKAQAKFSNILSAWAETEHGKKVAIVEGMLNAIMPGLARAIYGEVGVLTEADIELYKKTFISMGNTEDVNRALFDITKTLVDGQLAKTLNGYINNGKNVAGYAEDYNRLFPEKAAAPTTPQHLPGSDKPLTGTEVPRSMFNLKKKLPSTTPVDEDNNKLHLQSFDDQAEAQMAVNFNAIYTGDFSTQQNVRYGGMNYPMTPNVKQIGELLPRLKDSWTKGSDGKTPRMLISPVTREKYNLIGATKPSPAEESLQPVPSRRRKLPDLPAAETTEEPEADEVYYIETMDLNVSKEFIDFVGGYADLPPTGSFVPASWKPSWYHPEKGFLSKEQLLSLQKEWKEGNK